MRHLQAKDIMSAPVIAVRWDASIPEIVGVMRRHGISGVPVLNEFGLLCGVVTEANILEKEAGPGGMPELTYSRTDRDTALRRQPGHRADDIMVRDVVTASVDTTVQEIARSMVRHGINRVPIVDGENLLGIVTRADIIALFDRSPSALLADVRTTLQEALLMDPNRFEIVVVNGVVQIRGRVDAAADVRLIETFLGEIDGVSAVDSSHLVVEEPMSAR